MVVVAFTRCPVARGRRPWSSAVVVVVDSRFHQMARRPWSVELAIARRSEVVNNIEKHQKLGADSEENGTPEGAGPPFWASLGPMWPRSAPGVDFLKILGFIWGVISEAKWMKSGVEFRCVFGMLFGWVLD